MMKVIATFDIGTTNVKGVLMDVDGTPLFHESRGIDTFFRGKAKSFKEQDPRQWYQAFCEISQLFFEFCSPKDVIGIILSGQMQDLILLDSNCEPVMDAILYSDGRAQIEAEEIISAIGNELIEQRTGNAFDGSRPLSKLKWVKKHKPAVYLKAAHVLVSSKDYVIARLTGGYFSDVVSCSTAGLMDIETKQWCSKWLQELDLTKVQWPAIRYAHERAGFVLPAAAIETGYLEGTIVYAGSGDAGSATLAGGISQEGDFNINLGTSGWVACTNNQALRRRGVSNLAAMPEKTYINVVPFFNAGNVYRWVTDLLFEGSSPKDRYVKMDKLLSKSRPGSGGLLFLPYLAGERFPVMDADAAGCFVDVRSDTDKADMARAALEGVAYSIRQGLEAIGKSPRKLSLVGGGAKSLVWCQILADMLRMSITVFTDAEFLPSMAIAASVLIDQGYVRDYNDFVSDLQKRKDTVRFDPVEKASLLYDRHYARFCSIYRAVKSLSDVETE